MKFDEILILCSSLACLERLSLSKFNVYDVLDKFYEALHEKDRGKLQTFFTDEALYDDPDLKIAGLMVRTKEAIARTIVGHMSLFSKFKIDIKNVSVKGNIARVNWILQGSLKRQGLIEKKKFSGTDIFTFDKNGKIYHLRSMWNPSEHSYGRIEPA